MSVNSFFNRELSWLEFNQRVLNEARCDANPALEKLKFVAIAGSNLDEFFMVRVGGLDILQTLNPEKRSIDGLTASQQLQLIGERVREMKTQQYQTLGAIEAELHESGIQRLNMSQLSGQQLEHVTNRFFDEFQSAFSPIAVPADGEFPLLLNAKLCVLVRIAVDPDHSLPREQGSSSAQATERFAVIPMGPKVNRFVTLPSKDRFQYVLLEDVIVQMAEHFFAGQQLLEVCAFRLLRNADIQVHDDTREDLLAGMQEVLDARKTADCVMLELASDLSKSMKTFLCQKLDLEAADCFQIDGPLDMAAFWEIVHLQGFDGLRDPHWPPLPAAEIPEDADIFELIARKDRVLFHPYQSFDPVVQFVEAAASDSDVISIKQTLYRTSGDSRIVKSLIRAAENGKIVTAIVELKARFDEARNIHWAKQLERAGVDVIYGVKGLKTHSKICVVVRREPEGIRRYMHFGTGNYNEVTARIYSDISLLTCDEQLGHDAIAFFNAIAGFSMPQEMQLLVAAPIELRIALLALIRFETQRAAQGKAATISAKINSLVDREVIEALYAASQAGVKIRINVRGICCLRPGVEGLSENIQVCSIVDRFLEHARIFHFHAGGESKVFISSADWMGRNLNRRVELMVPVRDPDCKSAILDVLEASFRDNIKSHYLNDKGEYGQRRELVKEMSASLPFRSQQEIYRMANSWLEDHERSQATVFIPHRGDTESA